MLNKVILLLLISLMLLLSSCGFVSSPKSVATKFLDDTYALKYDDASFYASDDALMQLALMQGRLENDDSKRSFYSSQKIKITGEETTPEGTKIVSFSATTAGGEVSENKLFLRKHGLTYKVYAFEKPIAPVVSYFFKQR